MRTAMERRGAGWDGTVRLSEVLGALSHALDLTEGQPPGHCVRATWIGLGVGRALGLPEPVLWELYYTVMMKDLGCSSNAARICQLYMSDDIGFKRDFKSIDDSLPAVLGFVFSHTGLKAGLGDRLRAILNILHNGGKIADGLIETRCGRGAAVAASLRLPRAVCDGIRSLDEHWNGGGRPDRLAGEAIPLHARVALLAQVADVFHRAAGRAAALAEVRKRSGSWLDPAAVAAFERAAAEPGFWETLESEDPDEAVFALEPAGPAAAVDEGYLDDIARAFAHVIDSKSPFTSGHSERVAVYADLVAEELGYGDARRRWLRRAALLHDIGKLGVSNAILDKNGKLDDREWAEMRDHAALSERILERVTPFREMARIGGAHHERLDGRGYPRGLDGDAIAPETRIVSVADVFDALTADRPYRAALPVPEALAIMRADLGTAFDPACFAALERGLDRMSAELKGVATRRTAGAGREPASLRTGGIGHTGAVSSRPGGDGAFAGPHRGTPTCGPSERVGIAPSDRTDIVARGPSAEALFPGPTQHSGEGASDLSARSTRQINIDDALQSV